MNFIQLWMGLQMPNAHYRPKGWFHLHTRIRCNYKGRFTLAITYKRISYISHILEGEDILSGRVCWGIFLHFLHTDVWVQRSNLSQWWHNIHDQFYNSKQCCPPKAFSYWETHCRATTRRNKVTREIRQCRASPVQFNTTRVLYPARIIIARFLSQSTCYLWVHFTFLAHFIIMGGTCFKKVSWENKTKSHSYAQFLWLCVILMKAANKVAGYISKLDLWSQQPIRWTDLFWETIISIINKHKM